MIPPFEILLCTDEAYFQHLAVTVASLLANNRQHRFRITVAVDRPYPHPQTRLEEMVAGFGNAELRFVPIDGNTLENLPLRQHFTAAMYIRLFAAELLPPTVDKVLYLDCDLVVCDDIAELWNTDPGNNPLAAAPDMFMETTRNDRFPYVNSGVLLFNLRLWRTESAREACLRYIAEHDGQLLYPDQDAINAVFAGRIQPLSLRWNWQARMAEAGPALLGMSREQFLHTRRHPGIVHYTTGSKPWMYRKDIHYTGLYYHYLALTPWRGYMPPDRILRRRVGRLARLLRLKRWLRWVRAGSA